MELTDIRLGDTVRLRNGETFEVAHKITSYRDREGEHEGPFLSPHGAEEKYALADVAEIAARNERSCVFCGDGVTATDPEVDYCSYCFYMGRGHERDLAPLMSRLEAIQNVTGVAVWHTGGGCFNLAVTLEDGRLVTPSLAIESEGKWTVEPGFPEGEDDRWGFVVSASMDAYDEWDESKIRLSTKPYTDDQLVAYIAALADGRRRGMLELPGERLPPAPKRTYSVKMSGGYPSSPRAVNYSLTVPVRLGEQIDPTDEFLPELTPDGILYRRVER